jgi:hypothetical protein
MKRITKKRRIGGPMSPKEILNKLAPPRDVGLTIRDGRAVRKILQSDLAGDLRIPRGGPHAAELVAAYRHYDGATGGQPGYYGNIFIAWRNGTQTWRSGGVRVLPFEAERIARALDRGTGTRPGGEEPERVSGGANGTTSDLCATALDNGSVLLYVKFHGQGTSRFRSHGVEIHASERAAIADGLRTFARMRGRAK